MEVIAYHGWGFDSSCWQPWQQWVVQQGGQFQAFDRGYFGAATQPNFTTTGHRVILAHSYGLHLCPVEQLRQADSLVVFSSFVSFHPEASRLKRRSQQIVQQMIDRFTTDPMLVLQNFRRKCYQPQQDRETVSDIDDVDRLQQDLEGLNQAQLNLSWNLPVKSVMIIQGSEDCIVATAQAKRLTEKISQSQYVEVNGAGHALPFTHFAACQTWVESLLLHSSPFV
jgi:pimeloyl-[acyl-carrier protein] methyl ester esterase